MSVFLSMTTVCPNHYRISNRQNLNMNKISTEILLGKKKTSTTNTVFCSTEDLQIPKIFSSGLYRSAKNGKIRSAKNGKIRSTVEKEFVSTYGHLTSKMHDGLGITEFFGGKKLLITGSTGFLAQVY